MSETSSVAGDLDSIDESQNSVRSAEWASGDVSAGSKLYSALAVPPSAPQPEIRAQFYRLMEELNPEKHQGDLLMAERFESAAAAYQVLMEQSHRESYNREGDKGMQFLVMDPHCFYTIAVGLESFAPLVSAD